MVKDGHAHVNIVLPSGLWKRIRQDALDADKTASALIAEVMADYLDKKKSKGK